ncbi:unnamed protein product [Ascophyllum nodosum]
MKITTLKGSPTSETDDDGSLRAASPTRVKTPKNKSKSPSKGKGKSSAGEGEGVESFPELSDKKIAKKQKRKKTEAEEGMSNAEDEDLDATTAVETPKPKGKAKKSKGTSPKKRDRLSEDSLEEGELPSSKPKEAGPRVGDGRGIISNGNVEGRAVKRVRTRSMDAAEGKAARAGGDKEPAGGNGTAAAESHPSLDEFDISEATKTQLRNRGILSLFPIQAQTYAHIRKGKDLIGRARTGMGKTLAFAVPVIEKLLASGAALKRGRAPRVLVMAPTRELAKQVASDFELTAPSLETTCIYGGAPYPPQQNALSRGLDIVVGTPGRLLDHVGRGTLRLMDTEFLILDEADQMLDMGFKEEMEKVFAACGEEGNRGRQMLLFSATMPPWVEKVVKEYMKEDRVFIDLVKKGSAKASKDVEHIGIPCHWTSRTSTINDIISVYAGGGNKRTIVFCTTKKDCNDLCVDPKLTYDSQALHGDITQGNREATLAGFKKGSFKVLVATDVAARGLDMIVDLVLNSEPPSHQSGRVDTESYVHRSGRTGRAGRKGMCITLYTPRQRGGLGEIERHIGNAFSWRGAPQPDDIVNASAGAAMEDIRAVEEGVVAVYLLPLHLNPPPPPRRPAIQLIEEKGAVDALSAALACITGQTELMPTRSLLSNSEGFVTVAFKSDRPIEYMAYCWSALRRVVSAEAVDSVRGMQMAEDGMSCVFDVAEDHMDEVREVCEAEDWIEVCTELPPLKRRADEYQKTMRGGRGGGGRGGRGSLRGGGRGRGSLGGGRGRGGGRFSRGGVRGGGRGRGRGRGWG